MIERKDLWVFLVSLAVGLLLGAFALVVPVTAQVIGLLVAGALWVVRFADKERRGDVPYSLLGLLLGLVVGIFVPGAHIVEPSVALVGAWLMLMLAA